MRRSPEDIVYALSHALKEGRKGDEYSIAELAKHTGMHYVTVNNYLTMIEYVQRNIPKFSKIDRRGDAKIIVSQELEMDISDTERLLLKMFDRGAFRKGTAIASGSFDAELIESSVRKGDIIRTDSQIYLSRSGMMKGADLADKREERVMRSPVRAQSELRLG
ncbi:MAG: hypothetical protein FWH44_00200 [Methanomassiliicoccaceae archaeon]|nr:hypothetical protein [Methanomassiliicoccaceae archaeon]